MKLSKYFVDYNGTELSWRIFLVLASISVVLTSSDLAFAAQPDNDIVGDTLCRLVNNLTGNTAKGIATIAIFSVGVGLFLGKINWGIAAATAVGVGIIFGAPKLVIFLSPDSKDVCKVPTP